MEPNGSNDESKDTSTEPTPTSGTDVESCVDGREDMTKSKEPLPDEHLYNDSVEWQGKENSIPSFPYFALERQEATDGNPSKSVIRFFGKIPHEHYYTVCKIAEDRHGRRVVKNTVSFEFSSYDDALLAAQSIDKYLPPSPTKNTPQIVTNVTSMCKSQLSLQTMLHTFVLTCLRHPASGISSQHCDALQESFVVTHQARLVICLTGVRGASLCSENFRTRVSQLGFLLYMSPS